ncbi:hypothetical protein HMPREF1535_04036 [Parabacteroides goldsteinii DSM 19448 = WAL 12034]|uniref:Uncharacterized protein n=2 Tax=Parabacteroides goldsteinii TaxID=328812 RepID=A0A0F5IUF6_9BACT|nr:hypothetical protein HMPREF1535_04036 [Parabacteroides goldsteinii DSM 19448 = WAL 12034]
MRNYVIILCLLFILFSSCENDTEMINDFSVNFVHLNDNRGIVGKEMLCTLNIEGINEDDDEIYASYLIEGGIGTIFINEDGYEQNQEFNLKSLYKKKISFVYLPKVEGVHSLTFLIRKQLKGQVLERYSCIDLKVEGIKTIISDLESDVDIGNTTQFILSIDVDMKVFCKARFLKGKGSIEIANTDVVENEVLLKKNNKVLLTSESVGECRVAFDISGVYGRPIRSIVVINVVKR